MPPTDASRPHHVIPGGLSDQSLSENNRWRANAACRHIDGEIFFDTTSTAVTVARYLEAKEICRSCPVVTSCLSYVVDSTGRWSDLGLWGGLAPAERLDADLVARVLEHGADAIPDLYFQICAHCQVEKVYGTGGRLPGTNWYCQQAACRRMAGRGTSKSKVAAA